MASDKEPVEAEFSVTDHRSSAMLAEGPISGVPMMCGDGVVRGSQALAPATPATLLQLAMSRGDTDLDRLERLMQMQIAWEADQARREMVAAVARFKAACPTVIARTAKVSFPNKPDSKTDRTKYNYEPLSEVLSVCTPHLSAEGLSVEWWPEQDEKGAVTVHAALVHGRGASKVRSLRVPPDESGNKNKIQAIGSAISYAARYLVKGLLGLASEDDDGNGSHQRAPSADDGNPDPNAEPDEKRQVTRADVDSLPENTAKWLVALKRKGVTKADLEATAGRGLGKPAAEWTSEAGDYGKLRDIWEELEKTPMAERPAKVRELFELGSGSTEG